MKRIVTLSIFAASVAFAGGDIVAPAAVVEPTPAVAQAPVAVSPWSLGLLYGKNYVKNTASNEAKIPSLSAVLGYDLNDWLGLEGRLTKGTSDKTLVSGTKVERKLGYAAYLKPHMNLVGNLDLNGYLGYAVNKYDETTAAVTTKMKDSGFAYGAGLGYGITENVDLILDYIKYKADDYSKNHNIDAGVAYHF